MRYWGLLFAICIITDCGRRRSEHDHGRTGVKESTLNMKPSEGFELKVETTEGGTSMFVFRFPDRLGQIPRITSISIGKVGMKSAFCILQAASLDGVLIAGFWPVGLVPDNYRVVEGCHENTLSPGDYEVQVFTLRGEWYRRLHVRSPEDVQVLPWEESLPDSWKL
jgi:hypothetical protein